MQKDLFNIVTLDFQLFLYFLSFFWLKSKDCDHYYWNKSDKAEFVLKFFFNEIKPSLTEN